MPISFNEKDDVITMDSPKHSPKGGRPLKSSFSQRTTSSIKNETSKIINNEKNEESPFKQYFLNLAKESNVKEWKNTEDIEEICNNIRNDENFKETLNGYLDQNLALNGLGRKAFVKRFDKILSLHDGQESQAACLLYMQLVNTRERLDKVVTFKKNSKNRWRSDDGYFLSVDGNNVINANFSLLCRMAKSNFVMLCDPNNNNNKTIGVCNFYDGDTQLGVIAFGQGGAHVSDFTGGYNESGGQVEFYDSIEEWFGKDQLYMKIRNCNGNISSLVRDPDIEEIITGANLDPNSGKYSDYADAIWDRAAQREEIVAFFANPEWVLAKGSGEVVGKILQGEKAFIGAWPAPEVFYNKLVAKKNNGDAVEGQIKFYTDSGLYVGDIEFSENGQGTQAITPENLKLKPGVLDVINFKKAFLSESSKSKNSKWNTLTSVSAIRDEILKEPDFTTRLKNHLDLSKKVLNKDGLSYLKDTMKIVLPERYEVEAACLVYLNFLNNNKSDTNENDDPNTVSFERAENRAWYAFDNGGNPYYTIRIEGSDSEVAASDYVIYKMIQDKLIKVYKIDNQGTLVNPDAGSHKFKFVGTVEAKCGLTIEINDEGEVTKSTCKFDNDDAGYKAFYDKAKLVLGEEEFKKQIIGSSGSMGFIASVDKIAEILRSKNLDPASREYGKFAEAIEEYIKDKETLENAKNEALKDLYTKASALGISTESISEFDAEVFAGKLSSLLKPKVRTKVEKKLRALEGDEEKQIELLTRLLMRMERKKDFEKNHKFGKIRYALGEREKTDPKIKKCFEAAGKYIVKNYDKIDEKNLDRKRANLRSIFKDHAGEPWADSLSKNLKKDTVRRCRLADNIDEASCKAIMGIIFASMAGINDPKDIICACDALKKGGIKSSEKGTFLGKASQIRKSIKALCGRDGTTYDTRKAVIKKLLVNDYKFIKNASSCNELFPLEPTQSK